jgi:hypothetical protein
VTNAAEINATPATNARAKYRIIAPLHGPRLWKPLIEPYKSLMGL